MSHQQAPALPPTNLDQGAPRLLAAGAAIEIDSVSHRYGDRLALDAVSFDVQGGEILALLGPNGGGKTTLFRILCTSLQPSAGRVRVGGHDAAARPDLVRRAIGVVFQHASLDAKLTVRENLNHQGHLYGMRGQVLRDRIDAMLERFDLQDRAGDRVETLSGGLARRVDLAKGLLHRPRVLLLDEPSTGLDPQARWNLWQFLDRSRREEELSVLMTTHFMDEADRCDRVAIIDRGKLVAVDAPETLKQQIAGECLHVVSEDATALARTIHERFGIPASVVDGRVRIEHGEAHALVPRLVESFGSAIQGISLSRPSLEEVFIHRTGHRFESAAPESPAHGKRRH